MGSRNRTYGDVQPSALGDSHVIAAIEAIDKLCQKTMSVMTEYPFTREQTIPMLFPPDVLDRAHAAKGLIDPISNIVGYSVRDAYLYLDYTGSHWPAIRAGDATELQPNAAPLLAFIKQVRTIHLQFEELKGVLRWLNRNATPGAIRYYFPIASALCPQSPSLKALPHVPSRYTQPAGINDWMQSIKDASACYASAQLLPVAAKPRSRERSMWLTFPGEMIRCGPVEFHADSTTYNL